MMKKQKMTKAQETQYIGGEPRRENYSSFTSFYIAFLNWGNATFDYPDLKNFFVNYAKEQNYNLAVISTIPDYYFYSVGKLAYLSGKLQNDQLDRDLDKAIVELSDHIPQKVEKPQLGPDVSKYSEYWDAYAFFDNLKDNFSENATKYIQNSQLSIKTLKQLLAHYSENVSDWENEPSTPRLYKKIVTENINKNSEIVKSLNLVLTNKENSKSAIRTPRKKKAIPNTKLVEKLKFKKTDIELGLSSISPESIIGAQILIVFNCKTRKFGIFHAKDSNGFTVSGTTLGDYDDQSSVCKNLRKPKEQLTTLMTGTKAKIKNEFASIRSIESKLTGRINEDILLLKIFR